MGHSYVTEILKLLCNISWLIERIYNDYFTLLVGFILCIGTFIRLMPLLLLGLPQEIPYNGGGLYYFFTVTIIENSFHYPIDIPYYSTSGIPFAYNPLVFYLVAFLATSLKISPFVLHIYLPTIFSILSVLLFYLFSKNYFKDKNLVIASTFIYCILPQAFSELIPGEGLVESFGTMFYLLGIIVLFQTYRGEKFKYCILSGMIFGLLILGSPGGALAFAITLMIVPLFKENFPSAIKTILSVSIIGTIVSIPWWMTVIYYHGIGTIINGILVKNTSVCGHLVKLLGFNTGCGWFFGIALVLLGLIYCLIIRKWLLPIWFLFIFLAGEIGYIVPIIASLLIAIGLLNVILPSLHHIEVPERQCALFSNLFIILLCIHGVGTSLYYNTEYHYSVIPISYDELLDAETNDFAAMSWARDNIHPDSRFFLIGDYDIWWGGDWLPVLTQKTVINAAYGSEWSENFNAIFTMSDQITDQLKKGDINSSNKIAHDYGTFFTHLFVIKSENTEDLITILRINHNTRVAYENDGAILFEVMQKHPVEREGNPPFEISQSFTMT